MAIQWVVYNHTKGYEDIKVFKSERRAKKYRSDWLKLESEGLNEGQVRHLKDSQFKIYRCIVLTDSRKGKKDE